MTEPTKPLFSILTPTWNRGDLLPRVLKNLERQSFKDFEWVIANDGSFDGTSDVVKQMMNKSAVDISYIEASVRVGKARMDNEAITAARGELLIWCDSDDYLSSDALQLLSDVWKKIKHDERPKYFGIVALARTEDEVIFNPCPGVNELDISLNEIFGIYSKGSKKLDMVFCVRSELMKKNKFPEVDFVIPEGVVWSRLGNMKSKLLAKEIKIVEYGSKSAISFSNKMEYNRGRALSLARVHFEMLKFNRSQAFRFINTTNYYRYSIHGDISVNIAKKNWLVYEPILFHLICIIFARLLCLKDEVQGKVVKTHLEFIENNKKAKITRYVGKKN